MKPRGPLMIEHRLIEQMIDLIKQQVSLSKSKEEVDPLFIDTVVDFIRFYADRTHHGKEEDILFHELKYKKMNDENTRIMKELIEEHRYGRQIVNELVEAKNKYLSGQKEQLNHITMNLQKLIDFYPGHIQKEDKVFFPDTEKYFTAEELDGMIEAFWEFDRKMIHEKYKSVLLNLKEKLI